MYLFASSSLNFGANPEELSKNFDLAIMNPHEEEADSRR
jgi:hypothetical protein